MYTQVVNLAVYSFFCATLLGRQWLDPDRVDVTQVDYVFPFFTVLQFLFYVGWLKVSVISVVEFAELIQDVGCFTHNIMLWCYFNDTN